jgi:DNA primase
MPQSVNLLDQALAFHRALPDRIRRYLNGRGIPDTMTDAQLIGWTGSRISIPIRNRAGEIAFFKLRKDPEDQTDSPKMYATPGSTAELYGWERVLAKPESIVICEGEFDRLVLEARGFAAVTSTAGAGTFLPEWAQYFSDIPNVYLCFDHDETGQSGAARVAGLIPQARAITWPAEIGDGGDVTDFFVQLGRSAEDFRALFQAAKPLPPTPPVMKGASDHVTAADIDQVKSSVALEHVVARYLELRRRGQNYVTRCPFHQDRTPSFVVFPATRSFHCFGCRAHGDALTFLMKMEHLTFREALQVARQL